MLQMLKRLLAFETDKDISRSAYSYPLSYILYFAGLLSMAGLNCSLLKYVMSIL